MLNFCPNCGTEISDKVKFCTECGADIDSFSVKKDSASLPLTECFFYDCGVKTSKIYYCPLCGHDFCEKHKLHKDHYYGVQDEPKQPKSKPLKPTSSGSSIFEKPYFMIAFLFVIAAVITLAFVVLNLNTPTTDSVTTIPPVPSPAIPPPSITSFPTITLLPTIEPITIKPPIFVSPRPTVTGVQDPIIGVWRYSASDGYDDRYRFSSDGNFVRSFYIINLQRTVVNSGTWNAEGSNSYTLHYSDPLRTGESEIFIFDPTRNVIYDTRYNSLLLTPYYGDVVAASSSPATASTYVYPSPITGTIISGNYMYGGEGEFTIDNTLGSSDVVSSLTYEDSKKSLVAIYIRKGASYTINNIIDGTYNLYVLSGENWDPNNKRFVNNPYYLKFEDAFPFVTTRTMARTWEVTIYPVIDGNAKTKPISQDDFPKL